ncbi:MAG: hypothetical protein ACTILB_13480 [Brevibacterium aurantiacum]
MAAPVARGYQSIRQEDAQIAFLQIGQGNDAPIDWPSILPDWDVEQSLNVSVDVATDYEKLLASLHLDPTAQVGAIVRWYSPQSGIGGFTDPVVISADHTHLNCEIDSGLLAGSIELTVRVILIEPGMQTEHPFAAKVPGSIFWQDKRSIRLEGDESRFPMEVHPFSDLPQFSTGDNAIWYLEVMHWDYDEPAASALRLWLNADHEIVKLLLEGDEELRRPILQLISIGVTRQIAEIGIRDTDFDLEKQYETGSLGATIGLHVASLGPAAGLRERAGSDASAIEAQLQSHAWKVLS